MRFGGRGFKTQGKRHMADAHYGFLKSSKRSILLNIIIFLLDYFFTSILSVALQTSYPSQRLFYSLEETLPLSFLPSQLDQIGQKHI